MLVLPRKEFLSVCVASPASWVDRWGGLCVDDVVGLVAGTLEARAECLEVTRDIFITSLLWLGCDLVLSGVIDGVGCRGLGPPD